MPPQGHRHLQMPFQGLKDFEANKLLISCSKCFFMTVNISINNRAGITLFTIPGACARYSVQDEKTFLTPFLTPTPKHGPLVWAGPPLIQTLGQNTMLSVKGNDCLNVAQKQNQHS